MPLCPAFRPWLVFDNVLPGPSSGFAPSNLRRECSEERYLNGPFEPVAYGVKSVYYGHSLRDQPFVFARKRNSESLDMFAFAPDCRTKRWWHGRLYPRVVGGVLTPLLLIALSALCGDRDIAAQISVAQMYHKSWTPRDGAPENIESIAEGSDGFLWLAADTGLFRFDGVSFYRYTPSAGSSLLSNKFLNIYATPDGSLWIAYVSGGLARLKDGAIRNYTEKDGFLPNNQIHTLVEDHEGSVWAAGAAGLQKIASSQVTSFGVSEGVSAGEVFGVAVDQEGNVWATQYHQLVVLPHGAKRFIVAATWLGEELVWCAQRRGGGVWFWGPNQPVLRFQMSGSRILRTVVSPSIATPWHVREAEDGAVWVATQTSGILRFYPNKKEENAVDLPQIESFGHGDGLTDNFSFGVVEDAEGSLWVATINGLDQFRSVPFRAVDVGQNAPVVLPQGVSDSHFNVANDHVIAFTGGQPTHVALPAREMTWARSVFNSDEGDLWIGSNGAPLEICERKIFRCAFAAGGKQRKYTAGPRYGARREP